ncbi:hypothetical protein FOA52_008004 [Chlamydomonas sp. UWO 241]|nr:hypothetical protein FOA52_008004 [Chlamydomonas sp. UWO 241]
MSRRSDYAAALEVSVLALQQWSVGRAPPTRLDGRQPVSPGSVSPERPVPDSVPAPPWYHGRMPSGMAREEVHDEEGMARMRVAGALAARCLALAGAMVAPGVTTDELDAGVHACVVDAGGYPSPLRSKGFPKSVCASVNKVVCHGIPDDRPLQDGDIVNVHVTVFLGGVHADTSATFAVGTVSEAAAQLLAAAREALSAGIAAVVPAARYADIGAAIAAVARAHGLGVVTRFVGHGIGSAFHSTPHIHHHEQGWMERVLLGSNRRIRPSTSFTIEPLLVDRGGLMSSVVGGDEWTVRTADLGLTAQFEHTVLVGRDGRAEVVT